MINTEYPPTALDIRNLAKKYNMKRGELARIIHVSPNQMTKYMGGSKIISWGQWNLLLILLGEITLDDLLNIIEFEKGLDDDI